jgi:hypothetical protein
MLYRWPFAENVIHLRAAANFVLASRFTTDLYRVMATSWLHPILNIEQALECRR